MLFDVCEPRILLAATCTFTGLDVINDPTDWNDNLNWLNLATPTSADDVVFDTHGGTVKITADNDNVHHWFEIHSLTVKGNNSVTLNLNGHDLLVDGGMEVGDANNPTSLLIKNTGATNNTLRADHLDVAAQASSEVTLEVQGAHSTLAVAGQTHVATASDSIAWMTVSAGAHVDLHGTNAAPDQWGQNGAAYCLINVTQGEIYTNVLDIKKAGEGTDITIDGGSSFWVLQDNVTTDSVHPTTPNGGRLSGNGTLIDPDTDVFQQGTQVQPGTSNYPFGVFSIAASGESGQADVDISTGFTLLSTLGTSGNASLFSVGGNLTIGGSLDGQITAVTNTGVNSLAFAANNSWHIVHASNITGTFSDYTWGHKFTSTSLPALADGLYWSLDKVCPLPPRLSGRHSMSPATL